jgi:hypothetical protein
VTKPRGHTHEDGGPGSRHAAGDGPTVLTLSGRTRGNKLVHLSGAAELLGREVAVHEDHAGPYALRGQVVPLRNEVTR